MIVLICPDLGLAVPYSVGNPALQPRHALPWTCFPAKIMPYTVLCPMRSHYIDAFIKL